MRAPPRLSGRGAATGAGAPAWVSRPHGSRRDLSACPARKRQLSSCAVHLGRLGPGPGGPPAGLAGASRPAAAAARLADSESDVPLPRAAGHVEVVVRGRGILMCLVARRVGSLVGVVDGAGFTGEGEFPGSEAYLLWRCFGMQIKSV